jgi:L,D-transpeptidase catalytic domain
MRISVLRIALLAGALFMSSAASAAVLVTIDKSIQQMTVSVDGRALHQWPVSTGKGGYDTPGGKFKAFRMERDHYSKEWDEAPMPHSIFFTQKGHAIHGSLDVKRLGTPASHGCVRLLPANAKTLFELVEQEGVLNTTVVLTGVAPSRAPAVARRRAPSEFDEPQDIPQYGQPQYGQPQFGPRYGSNQPAYGNPAYAQPQYGQYAQPQYAQPQYAQPQYAQPQYAQPQYAQPQYRQPAPLPRPGYVYRDPYGEPVYVRPRGSLFPFQ